MSASAELQYIMQELPGEKLKFSVNGCFPHFKLALLICIHVSFRVVYRVLNSR